MFFEKSHSMVWYAMLCYAMVWYGKYGMLWDFNAMLWDFYAMLCYAMVYVVKDKHSATVRGLHSTNKNCFGKHARHRNGLNKICERHNEVKIPRHVTAIETNQIIILVFKYVDNYLFTFGLCFLLHKYIQWMNISMKVENKSFNEPKRIADKWVNKVFDLLKYLR